MITDSYERNGEPIISPASFFSEQGNICDIAIATFSREIHRTVLERYTSEQIGEIPAANYIRPIHLITADGIQAVFYLSEICAAPAATDVININWMTGADKFILFGSAGVLDREATAGKYVVPTAAYRDEGMSYHYAPPADYITIRNADTVGEIFAKNRIPYVKGRVWTTDAIFMETREQVRKRKAEGCLAVEMELAGVQAVCDHHGFELYDFLETGDIVDQEEYTPDGLHEANHSPDKIDIALAIARSIRETKPAAAPQGGRA